MPRKTFPPAGPPLGTRPPGPPPGFRPPPPPGFRPEFGSRPLPDSAFVETGAKHRKIGPDIVESSVLRQQILDNARGTFPFFHAMNNDPAKTKTFTIVLALTPALVPIGENMVKGDLKNMKWSAHVKWQETPQTWQVTFPASAESVKSPRKPSPPSGKATKALQEPSQPTIYNFFSSHPCSTATMALESLLIQSAMIVNWMAWLEGYGLQIEGQEIQQVQQVPKPGEVWTINRPGVPSDIFAHASRAPLQDME